DPYDVAVATAVHEIAVHGLGEVGTAHEATEPVGERGPAADQRWLVERTVLRETDEGSNSRADALQRACARRDFLYIDTRRKVRRHSCPPQSGVVVASVPCRGRPQNDRED